jgi:hypothetical protein
MATSAFSESSSEEGVHEVGAERAVEADGERLDVLDGVPEGFGGLGGDEGFAAAADGCGDHDGKLFAVGEPSKTSRMATSAALALSESKMVSTSSRSDAAGDEGADLLHVGGLDLVEGDDAEAGVVGVGRVGERDGERADGAGDEALAAGRRATRSAHSRHWRAEVSLISQARR